MNQRYRRRNTAAYTGASCRHPDPGLHLESYLRLPTLLIASIGFWTYLVENAIYHGIKPMAGKGTIRISGYLRDEHVLFEIADDGVGISAERTGEINAAMQEDYSQPGDHIGMINVNQRIKPTFGGAYGLTIADELDKGTTVRFILPIVI